MKKKFFFRKIVKNFIFRKMPPVVGLTLKMQTKKNFGLKIPKNRFAQLKKIPFFHLCSVGTKYAGFFSNSVSELRYPLRFQYRLNFFVPLRMGRDIQLSSCDKTLFPVLYLTFSLKFRQYYFAPPLTKSKF